MSRLVRRVLPVLLLLGVLLRGAPVDATTVVPVADEDLIDQARAIVLGEVATTHSRWDPTTRRIVTDVTVVVQEALKGPVALGPLVVRQLGGRVGRLEFWVDGSPAFVRGERALLFLTRRGDGGWRVAHLYQGKFEIRLDPETGDEEAVRSPAHGVRVLAPPGASVQAHTAPDRRRLEDVRLAIRARAGHRAAAVAPSIAPAGVIPAAAGALTEERASFTLLGTSSRWFEPDNGVAVSVRINSAGEPAAPGQGFNQVRDGLAAWNSVPGSAFRYADGGLTSAAGFAFDGVTAVSFRDPLGQLDPPVRCSGTLAMGGFFRDESQTRVVNGQTFTRIVEGDIVFADGWEGCGFYETYAHLAEIATHELGHVLGLGHSTDVDATMAAVAHLDGRGASLREDDQAGVRFIYPAPGATLSVVRKGAGAGTVTSSPAGIACGTDCAHLYPQRTAVTLRAVAATGSVFAGWTGGGCAGTGLCTVTMWADTSVGATFNGPLALRFASPAAGSTVSGSTTVTMAASGDAAAGYTFRLSVDGRLVYAGTTPSFAWNTTSVADGHHTLTATVTDSMKRTASATVQVTVTNAGVSPNSLGVSFTSPAAGATVRGVIWSHVWVEGASGSSNTFTLSVAGQVVVSTTIAAVHTTLAWDSRLTPDGPQTLTAIVRDATGKSGSATRAVTVANGASPPSPALTAAFASPAAGATVSGTVTVAMAVSGATGSSNTFRLAVDGTTVFTQTVAGTTASFSWNTASVGNGAHTLALTVTDASGRAAAAALSLTVANPTTSGGLSVSFTSPALGATVTGVAWVHIWVNSASASANTFTLTVDGRVVKTQTTTATHLVFDWNTVGWANGPQELKATVVDGAGKSGSGTRSVNVAN